MNVILLAVIVLGAIGLISAAVLYVLSKKFAVEEDPRIGQVSEVLPGANCGGCGFPGCGGMASACVKAADNGSLDGLLCPVGGAPTMQKIADILGMKVEATAPKCAVVRCNGSCENRPRVVQFDGVSSCRVMNAASMGETACAYGCLGCGDCVAACQFGAIKMNPTTGLPEVDTTKCTACSACAKACPRGIIEIREMKGKKMMGVAVECVNRDKGAAAMKQCKVSCIACQKCVKVCEFEAITVDGNVAHIDATKCKLCRKCEDACPRTAIHAINMPPRKPKAEGEAKPAAAKPAPAKPASAPAAKPQPAVAPAAKPQAEAAPAVKPQAEAAPAAKPQAEAAQTIKKEENV